MLRRIESRRYLTYAEARKILEDRIAESGGALNPTQDRTWQYLKLFGTTDPAAAREAVDALVKEGLDEYLAVQLVNMCPNEDGYINAILSSKEGLEIKEELLAKVKEALSKVCPQSPSK
ncbi:hypothetical protein [Acidilobus sp.]|jgi:DNA-directed RNA polymerase subunit F|uniref:hypothetical protein n=1 Tax=Acidilobus sp. TaxID=1872109 RepID=UPI003CFE524D